VSPHDVAYSPGPLRARSHHSSLSAPGDNSAPQQLQHHPQHHHPQSPLDLHPAARTSSSGSNAKRRADEADDGPAKQQRSKRNRVSRQGLFLSLENGRAENRKPCTEVGFCALLRSLFSVLRFRCVLLFPLACRLAADRWPRCTSVVHLDCMVSSGPSATTAARRVHVQRYPTPYPSPYLPVPSRVASGPTNGRQCADPDPDPDSDQARPFPDPCDLPPPPAVTNANAARSSAMARHPASAAAILACNVSTPRTAAPTSRTRTSSATWPTR